MRAISSVGSFRAMDWRWFPQDPSSKGGALQHLSYCWIIQSTCQQPEYLPRSFSSSPYPRGDRARGSSDSDVGEHFAADLKWRECISKSLHRHESEQWCQSLTIIAGKFESQTPFPCRYYLACGENCPCFYVSKGVQALGNPVRNRALLSWLPLTCYI